MSESQRDFLDSILRAMRPALMRPLASQALIDVKQIACGLLDRQGRLLATDHLGRAGTLHATSACILDYFGHELESGDVVMTNDPYSGGTRIQDLTLLTPIQSKGRNVGYAMAVCPLPDLGGNALGGNDPRALEIWAEGIRVTPTKLYRKGRREQDALTMLTLNSRLAELVVRDTEAMMAGLEVATGLFAGCPITDGSELCAESRSALHGALASISGDRSGVSDPIHQCMGEDLEVEVRLSREADDWVLNFAGSSGASPGFVNATAEASHAAAVSAVASALGLPGLPNAGLVEGFRSEFPEDCFLNAKLPLSVGWSVYGPAPAIDQAVRRALDAEPVSRRPVEIALQVAGCGRSGCPFPISPRRMEESRA